jgi:5'(3')-deoxyribonucleotidase
MSRIAVDLDGVCYEWDRTARYMLREYRGCAQLSKESASWNDLRDSVSKDDWDWLWTGGVKRGLFRYGHMVTGARLGLETLVRMRHKIIVVSHRPESAVSDTLEWAGLYFKGIPLSGFHIMSSRHSKTTVSWDLLIDDKPENIEDAVEADRTGYLFDRPWNQGSTAGTRVFGWTDVVKRLT